MQRMLNIHIYFKPGQFIWESEMEAGPTQGIKAGVTHARKGELIRNSRSGRTLVFKVRVTPASREN